MTDASLAWYTNPRRRYIGLGLVIAVATAISSVFNFLYGILAARSLGVSTFSEYASLVVLTGVLITALGSFQAVTAREVARNDHQRARLDPWLIKTVLVALAVTALILLFTPVISSWLSVSGQDVLPVAMTAPAAALFAVAMGRLIGREALFSWQLAGLIATSVKFLIGLGLFVWWASVSSFLWGPVVAAGAVGSLVLWRTRQCSLTDVSLRDRSVLTTGGIVILLWIAVHIDIIAARINLLPDEAGTYSAAASIAKSITVLLALAGTAVLPRISKSLDAKRFPRRLTAWLSVVLLILSLLFAIVFTYVGGGIIQLLFGEDFYTGENLLALSMWISIPWVVAAGLINAWMGSRYLGALLIGLVVILTIEIFFMVTLGTSLRSIMMIFGFTGFAAVMVALMPLMHPSFIQGQASKIPRTEVL